MERAVPDHTMNSTHIQPATDTKPHLTPTTASWYSQCEIGGGEALSSPAEASRNVSKLGHERRRIGLADEALHEEIASPISCDELVDADRYTGAHVLGIRSQLVGGKSAHGRDSALDVLELLDLGHLGEALPRERIEVSEFEVAD
jgi:hypothetical protein